MEHIIRREVIDPTRLSPVAQEAFIDSLYALHNQVFAGVTRERLAQYVVNPDASRTRIHIFKHAEGAWVGYNAVHIFEKELADWPLTTVMRAEAGLLPPYRGKHSPLALGFREVFRYKFRHPWRPLYYLGTLVHPSSYHMVCQFAHQVYPRSKQTVPADIVQLMSDLIDSFGVPPVDTANPLVRRVGWQVRDTPEDSCYWRSCALPDVQFFLVQNPQYYQGYGLRTLVPWSWNNLLRSFLKYCRDML